MEDFPAVQLSPSTGDSESDAVHGLIVRRVPVHDLHDILAWGSSEYPRAAVIVLDDEASVIRLLDKTANVPEAALLRNQRDTDPELFLALTLVTNGSGRPRLLTKFSQPMFGNRVLDVAGIL